MFDYIAGNAGSPVLVGDVFGDTLDLRSRISGCNRQADHCHHLVVGDIVTGIHDLFGLQTGLFQKIPVIVDFDGALHIYMCKAETRKADLHRFRVAPGNDGYMIAFLDSELQGIAVLYINGTHRIAVRMQGDYITGQNAVYIKDECLYLFQIIIDTTHVVPPYVCSG